METINLIFGASGFAKEVEWLIYEIYQSDKTKNYLPEYYVTTDGDDKINTIQGNILIISESQILERLNSDCDTIFNVFIGIGNPLIKEKIFNKLKRYKNVKFPSLIHPSAIYDKRVKSNKIGRGVYICAGCVFTSNIHLEDFVHLNLNVTIGHDSRVGMFTTISPGVNISGNVVLSSGIFLGTNSTLLENISVVSRVTIGASALVVRSIDEQGIYMGIPARKKTS